MQFVDAVALPDEGAAYTQLQGDCGLASISRQHFSRGGVEMEVRRLAERCAIFCKL